MALLGAYTKDDYLTRDELRGLPVPPSQGRWHHPVGFGDFVDLVDDEVRRAGMAVVGEEHYTQHDFKRHFGVLTLANGDGQIGGDGWTMMLGIRGSHDQSVGRGMALGRHVTVCSNGLFNGDLGNLSTKQSLNVWDRLRELVRRGLGRFEDAWRLELDTVEQLKQHRISDRLGDSLLVDIYRAGGLSAQQLGRAADEWVEPHYAEHTAWGRNLWLLEQAVTEVLKPTGRAAVSPGSLELKTRAVSRVLQGQFKRVA